MSMFFTIGHSDRALDELLDALRLHSITAVADVRTSPYSQRVPHFNREGLQAGLRLRSVEYVYLGDVLGGRPSKQDHYDEAGRALYYKMAADPNFIGGIQRLEDGAEKDMRIAIMCSEGHPLECHRHLLISRVLAGRGHVITHILRDNTLMEYWPAAGQIQESLFGEEDTTWRSIRSVLPRSQPSSSSDY